MNCIIKKENTLYGGSGIGENLTQFMMDKENYFG
jgi:hypothetical protein